MGIVRRHPLAAVFATLLLTPLGGVVIAQQLPPCRAWRAEVEAKTDAAMRARYTTGGDAQRFDRLYSRWDTTHKEMRTAMRAEMAHQARNERPGLCL